MLAREGGVLCDHLFSQHVRIVRERERESTSWLRESSFVAKKLNQEWTERAAEPSPNSTYRSIVDLISPKMVSLSMAACYSSISFHSIALFSICVFICRQHEHWPSMHNCTHIAEVCGADTTKLLISVLFDLIRFLWLSLARTLTWSIIRSLLLFWYCIPYTLHIHHARIRSLHFIARNFFFYLLLHFDSISCIFHFNRFCAWLQHLSSTIVLKICGSFLISKSYWIQDQCLDANKPKYK